MKLTLVHGSLYIDQLKFCKYEVKHDTRLIPGKYPSEVRYAHHFGKPLPFLDGIGWLGSDAGCQIIVGQVRSKNGLIPDGHLVRVLVGRIEQALDQDIQVLTEVQ